MSPVGAVISSIGVTHTQHADDTQLYVGHDSLWTMKCIKALHYWLDLNGLWLNPEKTEAVVLHKWKTAGWRPHWHNRHWSCPYQDTRQCEESGCRSVSVSTTPAGRCTSTIKLYVRYGNCYRMLPQRQSPAPWLLGGLTTVMHYAVLYGTLSVNVIIAF